MHTLNIFTSILIVLLLLGIFIPYINEALDTNSDVNTDGLDELDDTTTTSDILINILALPVWTFGLNSWINLIILLPLRIIGLIALYYIIFPTKS